MDKVMKDRLIDLLLTMDRVTYKFGKLDKNFILDHAPAIKEGRSFYCIYNPGKDRVWMGLSINTRQPEKMGFHKDPYYDTFLVEDDFDPSKDQLEKFVTLKFVQAWKEILEDASGYKSEPVENTTLEIIETAKYCNNDAILHVLYNNTMYNLNSEDLGLGEGKFIVSMNFDEFIITPNDDKIYSAVHPMSPYKTLDDYASFRTFFTGCMADLGIEFK